MKRILSFLLLTLALAGCTTEEPQADGPAMGMPVPGSDVDDTETLPEDTSEPANGFAPQQGHQEAASEDVSLVGDFFVEECGTTYCIHAKATNEGSTTLYVKTSQEGAFLDSLKQRESQVTKHEPMGYTMEWSVAEFAPGQTLEADFTWDGRLWDDDAQEYRAAPEDSYTWSIQFQYFEGDDGSGGETLTVAFPVIVGET